MECKLLVGALEFCTECDHLSLFIGTMKCMYCGCDTPFAPFDDDSISYEKWLEYEKQSVVYIGKVSDITDPLIIEFLNDIENRNHDQNTINNIN